MAEGCGIGHTELILIHLMSCALTESDFGISSGSVDWEAVRSLAIRNSVESLTWMGLGNASASVPREIAGAWEAESEATLWRQLQFDYERELVLEDMRSAGLSYLPLKGVGLAPRYPKPGMRSMCDNDILYGYVEEDPDGGYRIRENGGGANRESVESATDAIRGLMEARGYSASHLGTGNADAFERKPIFNFEMHRVLVESNFPWADYYANPWKRAIKDEADGFSYSYSLEDEYIFHIAHAFKHLYNLSGCGVRVIADEWVLVNGCAGEFDWDYVRDELESLGMAEFETALRELAVDAIGLDACGKALRGEGVSLSEEHSGLIRFMAGNGTYGTFSTGIENWIRMAEESGDTPFAARARYVFSRLAPSQNILEEQYPVLHKYPLMRPAFLLWRMVSRGMTRIKKVRFELRSIRNSRQSCRGKGD